MSHTSVHTVTIHLHAAVMCCVLTWSLHMNAAGRRRRRCWRARVSAACASAGSRRPSCSPTCSAALVGAPSCCLHSCSHVHMFTAPSSPFRAHSRAFKCLVRCPIPPALLCCAARRVLDALHVLNVASHLILISCTHSFQPANCSLRSATRKQGRWQDRSGQDRTYGPIGIALIRICFCIRIS